MIWVQAAAMVLPMISAWSGSLLLCCASALASGQVGLSQELAGLGAGLGGHVGQPFVHVGLEEVGMVQEMATVRLS